MKLRLFSAIELPVWMVDAIDCYGRQQIRHWPASRWTKPENLHLTVSFFGNVANGSLAELRSRLAGLAAGFPAFELRYRHTVLAPPSRPQRSMIWAEFAASPDYERLSRLVRETVQDLAPDLPMAKPARPHVTLARLKQSVRKGQADLLPLQIDPDRFVAQSLSLFESELKPGGSDYHLIERFPLQG